jgi:hypothetical protein
VQNSGRSNATCVMPRITSWVRCFNEGLIDEDLLRRTCKRLDIGVEARDLRWRT